MPTNELINYATHLLASSESINWLNTTGIKALKAGKVSQSELEHVLDYLVSNAAPKRLQKMSISTALKSTEKWSSANQKKGKHLQDSQDDIETVHDFLNGSKIVKLKTKQALQREGFLMSHCVGSYDVHRPGIEIYSYRDAKNMPHATFEVAKNQGQIMQIMQIKGKGNGEIHPKYIHPILAFLQNIGMQIRPLDMRNLGYYYVDKSHIEFLKQLEINNQLVAIAGEYYVY